MSKRQREIEEDLVRVELKYCEHCGGLWVRENGKGVYCERCQPKVADLPIAKKRRLMVPAALRAQVEDYDEVEVAEPQELEGVGGVA